MSLTVTAILLGILEGLTEFIPVSSTGHLVLATRFLGYDEAQWAVFNVVIQLPAILAVVVIYWRTFWDVLVGLFKRDVEAARFTVNVLAAFIPSAILGVLLKHQIDLLLETPVVVAWALVLGGVAILVIEKFEKQDDYQPVGRMPLPRAVMIGLFQCLAMIPGVSRSGATIMGALALGTNRKTAAEFSFFLAVPTMFGATAKQLWDNRAGLAAGTGEVGWHLIAIGSVMSFLVALVVIRLFLSYVSRNGFAPFAWYRIIAGGIAIVLLTIY